MTLPPMSLLCYLVDMLCEDSPVQALQARWAFSCLDLGTD